MNILDDFELLDEFKLLYEDAEISDELYKLYLSMAGDEIYIYLDPYFTQPKSELLARYEMPLLKLAASLLSKRGAEAQQSHSENSISRAYTQELLRTDILVGVSPYGRLL